MTKVSVARKFRDEYGMEMPTRKLARIMYEANNLLFKDTEEARSFLRHIEGKVGNKTNARVIKTHQAPPRPTNPYRLPDSDAVDVPPRRFIGYSRALIMGDVHLPYHDIPAITLCLDYAKKEKPDLILIDGDLIDCHKLSKFVKDPKKRDFKYELDQLKQFFVILRKTFPKSKIVYKLGNHEIRYEHFLFTKAKEINPGETVFME